jgi:hypothetical protein
MEEDTGGDTERLPPEIAFDYIKGAFFRVVHADGVTGGIAPSGNIHMAFFSERGPIPQREVRSLNSDGIPGNLVPDKSIVRPAVVREVDVDVVMSLRVAEAIRDWLDRMTTELKKATTPSEKGGR